MNGTDTAFMNMAYKNTGLVLAKLVTNIAQLKTLGQWNQKGVHYYKRVSD